jgi:hypothetical protein
MIRSESATVLHKKPLLTNPNSLIWTLFFTTTITIWVSQTAKTSKGTA